MKRPRLWPVWVWLGGVVACIAILSRTSIATDMSAFLPRAAGPVQQLMVDQLKDGAVSRLILIGISGASPEVLAELSKTFADTLRKTPEFALVSNGEEKDFESDRAFLWTNRYLLSPGVTAERFTVDGLRAALKDDLDRLGGQAGILIKHMLPADPTGEMLELVDRLSGTSHPVMRDGVWFSPDFSRAMLMARTKAPAFDIDRQQATLGLMRQAFEAARRVVPQAQNAHIDMSGPAVFAVISRDQIRSDAMRLSIIATLMVASVLLVVYRSALVLVLGLLPVGTGILAGISAVSVTFGFVHGITLGFGVTLIGEAVDYGIYLLGQSSSDSPPKTTLKRIWPTLGLGLLTSVAGFSAMLFSGFPGFVQLGLFTITGLTVAALVTRWVLPALVPAGFKGVQASKLGPVLSIAVSFASRCRFGVTAILAVAMIFLVSHRGGFWEDELSSMNPVPTSALNLDRTMRQDIGAPDVRYMIMLQAAKFETVLSESERVRAALAPLVAQGMLTGFDAPSRYLPPAEVQLARKNAIPVPDVLARRLRQASAELPFRPDLFASFLRDADVAKKAPLLSRESLEGTSLALKLDSLLLKRKDGWTAILSLQGVNDLQRVKMAVLALGVPGLAVIDLKHESDSLLATYLGEAQSLSVIGGLGIVVLLVLALRALPRLRAVLAPLAAAVIVTAAILTLGGQRLSIFNLFGLLLTVAVGSNYCLFFERTQRGLAGSERVLVSVVLANLCTIIGFGVLSFSGVPVLHGIGMTVAMGTFLSLLFGAVLSMPQATRAGRIGS